MTLATLFLVLVPTYLVLIAYGQVGARRRGLAVPMRLLTGALRVTIPPVALILALLSTGDARLIAVWGMVILGMAIGGIAVAVLADFVAQRVAA